MDCPFFFFVCPWVLKQKVISKKIILSDLEVLALYNLHSECKYIQLSAGIYCFIGIPPIEGHVYILFSVAFGLVICGIMWNLYELYNNSQQRPINVNLRCQVQHHLNYEKFPGWPNARVKAFYDYLDPTGGSLCKLYPNIIGEWFIIYVNGYPYVAVVPYIFYYGFFPAGHYWFNRIFCDVNIWWQDGLKSSGTWLSKPLNKDKRFILLSNSRPVIHSRDNMLIFIYEC